MHKCQISQLAGVSADEFRKNIELFLRMTDAGMDDFVLFAGVVYHVTDPILALRITFDCLKDVGKCLLETYSLESKDSVVECQGSGLVGPGSEEELNRGGWNWFVPSPAALRRMMCDVGYQEVTVGEVIAARAFAVGTRSRHVDMMRGGLSIRATR
jgi:hypothetical protein